MSISATAGGLVSHDLRPAGMEEHQARLAHLKEVIERAAHLLPSQGPITVFIHHNTLHAFEELPFEEAVKKGAHVFGCHPYLTEERYRQEVVRGRIRFADLWEALREDLKDAAEEKVLDLCSRLTLRLTMLQYPLRSGPTEELVWYVAETDALRRVRGGVSSVVREQLIAETRHWVLRDLRNSGEQSVASRSHHRTSRFPEVLRSIFERLEESTIENWSDDEWEEFTLRALWRVCCNGTAGVPAFNPPAPVSIRHRDLLLAMTGQDSDLLVHDILIRFCAAFLDQGFAPWQLPHREEGFFRAFCALYRPGRLPDRWLRGLAKELGRLEDAHCGSLESIHESLHLLGVAEGEWYDYLAATLLALPGWAGMIRQMELRGDRVVRPAPEGSLLEYLSVRLILDRLALADIAAYALAFTRPLRELRDELRRCPSGPRQPSVEQRAFGVFQLAQLLGWTPEKLHHLTQQEWGLLLGEIESFSERERRRIFHLTYEQGFYRRSLDAIALHAPKPAQTPTTPRF